MKKKVSRIFLLLSFLLLLVSPTLASEEILISQCLEYLKAKDFEKALQVGEMAVKVYPQNSLAYLCLGKAYLGVKDPLSALDAAKKAQELAKNARELSLACNLLGRIYEELNDLDNALLNYHSELLWLTFLNEKDNVIWALIHIAIVFDKKGDFDKALETLERALSLQPEELQKIYVYGMMGVVYEKKNDYEKAIDCLKKAIEIGEKHGKHYDLGSLYLSLGESYEGTKDYLNAEKYFLKSLEKARELGDKELEAYAYLKIGTLYLKRGNVQMAESYFVKTYDLFRAIGNYDKSYEIFLVIEKIRKQKSLGEKEKTFVEKGLPTKVKSDEKRPTK